MKNIFRPHIVREAGKFRIRKWVLWSFRYLDYKDKYWWYKYGKSYSTFETLQDATKRLQEYRQRKPLKTIHVYSNL